MIKVLVKSEWRSVVAPVTWAQGNMIRGGVQGVDIGRSEV